MLFALCACRPAGCFFAACNDVLFDIPVELNIQHVFVVSLFVSPFPSFSKYQYPSFQRATFYFHGDYYKKSIFRWNCRTHYFLPVKRYASEHHLDRPDQGERKMFVFPAKSYECVSQSVSQSVRYV